MPKNQAPSTKDKQCFVCAMFYEPSQLTFNKRVNLPVCLECKGQKEELLKEKEHLDCLGDGFTVGCIS